MFRFTSYLKYPDILQAERVVKNSFSRTVGAATKRVFDIVCALMGLILLAPPLLVIVYLIRRDSPGPILYRGPRAGRHGRPFNILKFRTMYERQESYQGLRVTGKNDDRITPLGHWLRNTKINELPQLWNVLIGEMSLVGPRPEDVEIAATWPPDVRREILSVRPGITSPASIVYRDEETLLAAPDVMSDYMKSILPDKIRLDRLYIRNRSFFVDLDTVFWTVLVLVPTIANSGISEGHLFSGPISRLTTRYLSWFFADSVVALIATAIVTFMWRLQDPLNWGMAPLFGLSLLMALLFSGLNSLAGVNRIVWSEALAEDGVWLVFTAGLVTVIMSLLNYFQSIFNFLPWPSLPLMMIFTIGLMASIGFVIMRYRYRLLFGLASRWLTWRDGAPSVAERVLIVGSGEGSKIANWLLKQGETSRILSIIGVIDDEQPNLLGMRVKGNTMLGGTANLGKLIEKYDVGVVLFATPKASDAFTEKVTDICNAHDVRMVMLTDLLALLQNQLTQPVKQHSISVDSTYIRESP